jgi:hypothetical protein
LDCQSQRLGFVVKTGERDEESHLTQAVPDAASAASS